MKNFKKISLKKDFHVISDHLKVMGLMSFSFKNFNSHCKLFLGKFIINLRKKV